MTLINSPSDNLKMLLIGLLALSVLAFLLPEPAHALTMPHLQDVEISADEVGVYLTITPTVDLQRCYEAPAYDWEYWQEDLGKNDFRVDWPDLYPDRDFLDRAFPVQDFANYNSDYCETYEAGETYKFYLVHGSTPHVGYTEEECLTINKSQEELLNCVTQPENTDTGVGYDFDFNSNTSYGIVYGYNGDQSATGTYKVPPLAEINTPAPGSELDAPFNLTYDYQGGTGYAYGIFYMEQENQNGEPVYSYQALEPIATSTATGTVNFTLPDSQTEELAKGYYNDCKCFLQKSDGTLTDNLCPDYELTILTGSRVTLPPPEWEEISTSTAENFYEQHSDYATPTPAFDVIFESIEPFYGWTNNIAEQFAGQFNPENARERGAEMGSAIVKARAYAGSLNSFFGGLPVAWILLFYVITALALTVFKLIYRLVDLIKP